MIRSAICRSIKARGDGDQGSTIPQEVSQVSAERPVASDRRLSRLLATNGQRSGRAWDRAALAPLHAAVTRAGFHFPWQK
jgi:hypothetical protein